MHYRNPDILLCKILRIDKPMRTRRTRRGRKTADKTAKNRKRKRKSLPNTPDEAPDTQDNLGKEVAVDKDPQTHDNLGKEVAVDKDPQTQDNLGKEIAVDKDPGKEPTPDTQDKDPEQDMGLPTVTQPKDKTSSRERNVHFGGMSALLRANQKTNTTESGKEQDKTVETDKPSAPSSTVSHTQALEYQAKAKECNAKAAELKEKRENAECFDPHSVCNIACSVC